MKAPKCGSSAVVLAVLAALANTGCSSKDVTRTTPVKPDDYLTASAGKMLETDTGFEVNPTYEIPVLSDQVTGQPVGDALDIQPPALVLTIADGSQPVSDQAAVLKFVASPGTTQDPAQLSQQLWQAMSDFSQQGGLSRTDYAPDQQQLTLQTGGGEQPGRLASLLGREGKEPLQQFRMQLTPAAESAGYPSGWLVGVRLIGIEVPADADSAGSTGNGGATDGLSALSAADKQRLETALLNRFSGFYQTLREDIREAEVALSGQIELSLAQDANGVAAFIADNSFDPVWKRLPGALQRMNFKIRDRNRALGTYYVEYDPPVLKSGGLFGKKETTDSVQLERRDYEVQLGDMGEETSITFNTDGGKPLTEEQLNSFYTIFTEQMRTEGLR